MKSLRKGFALLVLTFACLMPVLAQVATTTVRDTVYRADGSPAQGSVVVSWNAFTTPSGVSVQAGSTTATIGPDGQLSLVLAPNQGATPLGSYYTAVYHLNDGTVSKEYWVVPTAAPGSSPTKLTTIRNEVLPASVATQSVSKQYVDSAVSAVSPIDSSAYVQKAGDTMTGPLVLPGDPTTPLQAADKNYVDTNVSALTGGLAGKVALLPSATQAVNQPANTQLEVNRLNGVLYPQEFITTPGDQGIVNALSSPDCASGCTVNVEPTYTGQDTAQLSLAGGPTHLVDHRGGAEFHQFRDPASPTTTSSVAQSIGVEETLQQTDFATLHPGGSIGGASQLLTYQALAGGSNQAPSQLETPPYFKTTYSVQTLDGTYQTQGQHIQHGSSTRCYAIGDCIANSELVTSSGGPRDPSDEGTKYQDVLILEDQNVYKGTCSSNCSTGSTMLTIAATESDKTQGDGRYLIDTTASKTISTGSIIGGDEGRHGIATFSGTSFPVSVFLETAAQASSQPNNISPGTVVLPIATSSVPTGFATSTAALPSTSGVACVADADTPPFQFSNFETAAYTVVDASHLQLTLNKVHASGATVAVGGLCGYGLEQKVDTASGVRQVFPVVGSTSSTTLYYIDGSTTIVGRNGFGGAYINVSLPITSATRSGNVVTVVTTGYVPYDLNGLTLTVSGVSDPSYNGSFTVSTTNYNTFQYADAGPDSSSSGGTISIVTGDYTLYPMAEVLSVYNPTTKAVDGTFTLAANTVDWASGDTVEEPHYFQQSLVGSQETISQFLPRGSGDNYAGKNYSGSVGPGLSGWVINNANTASSYYGGGGSHIPPNAGLAVRGPWNYSIEAQAGASALIAAHCSLHGCNRWDSTYSLFQLDSATGGDLLQYAPQSSTATWRLNGQEYTFSPTAFTAGTINAGTLNASTINGDINGSAITSGTIPAARLPIFGPSGTTHAPGAVPDPGSVAGSTRFLREDGTWSVPAGSGSGGSPTGSAGGDLGGTYPNPTVSAVHATSGTLDGVTIGASTPANVTATKLTIGSSTTYPLNVQSSGASFSGTAKLVAGLNGPTFGGFYLGYDDTRNTGVITCGNNGSGSCGIDFYNYFSGDFHRQVTMSNAGLALVSGLFHEPLTTPASSSAACTAGDFTDDANYHYVCVATNTWKRVALSTF